MSGLLVAAALLSAFLHAAWNAAVKSSADAQGAMAAQVVAAGLLAVPLFLVVPLPPLDILPWLAASTVLGLIYLLALLQGYARGGGFGLVYPLARATSPLLVVLLANLIVGEVPSRVGIVGIALVSGGVALFAGGDLRKQPAALAYGILAGTFAAATTVADAQGARIAPSPLSYGLAVSICNALAFGTVHRIRSGIPLLTALRTHAWLASGCAVASTISYLLILWVWSRGPVAIGAALRDTSVLFAALLAVLFLGEPMTRRRAGAIALVAFGAAVLRFA